MKTCHWSRNNPLFCYRKCPPPSLCRTWNKWCSSFCMSELHSACTRSLHNNAAQEHPKGTKRCGNTFSGVKVLWQCDKQNAALKQHQHICAQKESSRHDSDGGKGFDSYFHHSAISMPVVSSIAMVTADYHLLHNSGCALKLTGYRVTLCRFFVAGLFSNDSTDKTVWVHWCMNGKTNILVSIKNTLLNRVLQNNCLIGFTDKNDKKKSLWLQLQSSVVMLYVIDVAIKCWFRIQISMFLKQNLQVQAIDYNPSTMNSKNFFECIAF